MDPATRELDYGPPPRWHQRARFRWLLRRGVLVVLLLAAAFWAGVGWKYLRKYRAALQAARAADQAARYTPSAMHVAYDDDPQTYPRLLASGGGYVSMCRSLGGSAYAVYDNPAFTNLFHAPYVAPTVFLHELHAPKGKRRIVAVQIARIQSDPSGRFLFEPCLAIADSSTLGGASRRSPTLHLFRTAGDRLRIYDGHADPNNASRFTIDLDYNGHRMQLVGELLDDDRVLLTPSVGQFGEFSEALVDAPGRERAAQV